MSWRHDCTVAPRVAYFSMEMGVDYSIPTYSGGLGTLAGDSMKSSADLGLPVVGVTLLSTYPKQVLDESGWQTEVSQDFDPREKMYEARRFKVNIGGQDIAVKAWQHDVRGRNGIVPTYFLDTSEDTNGWRDVTRNLYDDNYRLHQQAVLGIAGVRLLQELGYDINTYHMQEGHSALAVAELFRQLGNMEKVRELCVVTIHSPVAGNDSFDYGFVRHVVEDLPSEILELAAENGNFSMGKLALNASRYANAVSRKHAEACKQDYITNGVHSYTWASEPFQRLYDKEIPEWRQDPTNLVSARQIDRTKISAAHQESKEMMAEHLEMRTGIKLDPRRPILSYGRRAVEYKRLELPFLDREKFAAVLKKHGTQLIAGAKAHPNYYEGKLIIQRLYGHIKYLQGEGINAAFIPNYDMLACKRLTSGSDAWPNMPEIPLEASGTSGMCAAHSGVPQFSSLDGWWPEGHIEGITGWSIGGNVSDYFADADSICDKLDKDVLPNAGNPYIMAEVISRIASHFNTERMMRQYAEKAYRIDLGKLEKVSAAVR